MWKKTIFCPLRDFDQTSTYFRMISFAIPRLIRQKKGEFHPLWKGWNYVVLCGIMWNKWIIPCVWRGCAAAPAPPTMLSLRPMTIDNSNGCACLHALLLCIWPMQLLYILDLFVPVKVRWHLLQANPSNLWPRIQICDLWQGRMIYSKAIWLTKEQIDPEESSFALSADLHHKWNYVELCGKTGRIQ